MTFGRPSTVPDVYMRLDLPQPLPPSDNTPASMQEISTQFFNASM